MKDFSTLKYGECYKVKYKGWFGKIKEFYGTLVRIDLNNSWIILNDSDYGSRYLSPEDIISMKLIKDIGQELTQNSESEAGK